METVDQCCSQLLDPEKGLDIGAVIDQLNRIETEFTRLIEQCELLESVHPDEAIRSAAESCRQTAVKHIAEFQLNTEVYGIVEQFEPQKEALDEISRRYLEHVLRDFRRAGVNLEEGSRQRVKALKEELVQLSQEFGRNIREDTRYLVVDSAEDLAGLPKDYIEAHRPDESGKVRISTNYPDFVPFMNYASKTEHRKNLYFEYMNRAYPKNLDVLLRILTCRHELARLLGHDSWAAYVAEDKMIRSASAIEEFIDRIAAIAERRAGSDYNLLLTRKKADHPEATRVDSWEKSYYFELLRSESTGFDSQEIRPYLEYQRVKQGVLAVTEKLFGLSYSRVDDPAWHESVETFDVRRAGRRVGRFYLDMHPRQGKFKHAAMFPIVAGVRGVSLPEAALVCNFPDPDEGLGLLEHSDVVTFFHEFGHLLHHLLGGEQPMARFSGVATEWDFVEVPSQLLEEWAWDYETLSHFAVHHQTGSPIPREMVEQMRSARSLGRGTQVRQQMFYAALSLTYHYRDPQGLDTTAVLKALQNKFSPFGFVEGTHLQANFGHLDGYSALYYTYMWSRVIACDLHESFQREGMFNQAVADRYVSSILAPGGTRDAELLVRDFVGRDFGFDAFEQWILETVG